MSLFLVCLGLGFWLLSDGMPGRELFERGDDRVVPRNPERFRGPGDRVDLGQQLFARPDADGRFLHGLHSNTLSRIGELSENIFPNHLTKYYLVILCVRKGGG